MDGFIGGFLAVFFICLTVTACYVVGRVYDHKEIMAGVREADRQCEKSYVEAPDPHEACCGTVDHSKCCGIPIDPLVEEALQQ